jgi:hypothetical protein
LAAAGDVVVVVGGTIVEFTKALATPAPMIATDVTIAVGRILRRARDRDRLRIVFARLAARRWLATSNSSGSRCPPSGTLSPLQDPGRSVVTAAT